ncbi:MAG: cadmium-translocating P-type ATPase [Clostridia bacterium]|nr:cadmium-translocating P-type ATPase [Clostridia bacterium]
MTRKQKKTLIRIIISAVLFASALALKLTGALNEWICAALFIVSYLTVGYDILIKAVKGIVKGQLVDENFLMAVASAGAMALRDFAEAAAVMLFYQIGELFQSVAVGKSRRSIAALIDIRPDVANLVTGDGVTEVDPAEVEIGSSILINPGERIPLDGVITDGSTTVDTCAVTGESVPRDSAVGDEVYSGCVNLTGAIRVRTTKGFGESTASRILELVEESGMRKSRSEALITRFARIYTPVVCILALLLASVPPIFLKFTGGDPAFGTYLKRALTFLVISCPCALVISVPLTFFGGVGCASRNGILIKGSNFFEALAETKYFVFDKTGTLTEGRFRVTETEPFGGFDPAEVLSLAARAEFGTRHPVGIGIREAAGVPKDDPSVSDLTEKPGFGVTATVDGMRVSVGNPKLMKTEGIEVPERGRAGETNVWVSVDGALAARIALADAVKDRAAEALNKLRSSGVEKTYMLTGDRRETAEKIAADAGIDRVKSDLLPSDKLEEFERIKETNGSKGKYAYVGDGINDAPVLALADVGIAMGAMGTDAAIEAADVVLMDDDVMKLPLALRIARRTLAISKENIAIALLVKLVCLVLGALGFAGMWLAIFADVGVMVLAVLNSTRSMRIKG